MRLPIVVLVVPEAEPNNRPKLVPGHHPIGTNRIRIAAVEQGSAAEQVLRHLVTAGEDDHEE
jgi:hypothetical protein